VDDQLQQVGRGIYVLTASTATQTAREKDGDEYSLLTKYILHGIAHGEADHDDDGLVSMDDLYEYVRARVPREAPQHPMKWALGIQGGEFVIARAAKVYSLEQLRIFREEIKGLDDKLPDDVYDQAIHVIRAGQPKQDKQFLSLLEALSEKRVTVGQFISRWLALGLPLSVQQQRELVAQEQRELEEKRRKEEQLAEERRQRELEEKRRKEEEQRKEEQRQRELEEKRRKEEEQRKEEQRQRELEEKREADRKAQEQRELEEKRKREADVDDTVSSREGFGAGNVNEWDRASHDSSEEKSARVKTNPGKAEDTAAEISDAVYPSPNTPTSSTLKLFKREIIISISIFLAIAVFAIVQWRKEGGTVKPNSTVADYTRAIELKPDDAEAYYKRGKAHTFFIELASNDVKDRAIADYSKAIELKPDYADAYINRGRAYAAKGDKDRAIADYTKVIELKPNDADAYNKRGDAYNNKGDRNRAIADYTKVIELKPNDADAYINRGCAYNNKGDRDRAIADFTKAIELKSDYALAYRNRGIVYGAKGDRNRAIADYTKAIELEPDDADTYLNRGNTYDDKGDKDRAIADYTKAIDLKSDDAEAYFNRGLAYAAKGDKNRAIADFRKSHELFTSPSDRKDALQQLRRLGAE
jgi:tetratricopeptide (TPR) repeat protein